MKNALALLTLAALISPPALADGSVDWKVVEPLLADHPDVKQFLQATVNISPTGMAARFGWQQPHLGGARIGPYHFQVQPKSGKPKDLVLTVCTEPTFFDQNGNTTNWPVAYSFKERLDFIALTDSNQLAPVCNDWIEENSDAKSSKRLGRGVQGAPPNPSLQRTPPG